jgi:hypothetical protein
MIVLFRVHNSAVCVCVGICELYKGREFVFHIIVYALITPLMEIVLSDIIYAFGCRLMVFYDTNSA